MTTASNRNEFGKTLKQQRHMAELTLRELAAARSGVSASHLGRIERGERFPSGHILRKIAKPLGLAEAELLAVAGYLSPQPPGVAGEEYDLRRLNPYMARVLSEEPIEIQRSVIAILTMLKSIARGSHRSVGFREYAHSNYPEIDEDTITIIEDILEHLKKTEEYGG